MSLFCVEVFSSRITEKLSRGTLLCFTKFPVSKTLWKRGGEGGREGVSIFSVEFFLSPVSKNFVGGSFIASFFWVSKNVRCKGAGIRRFRQIFFVSVPEKVVGEPLSVSLLSDIENFFA